MHHVLFRCSLVEDNLKAEAYNVLVQTVGEESAAMDCSMSLVNASRNKDFLEIVNQIICSQINSLHTNIEI